LNNPVPFIRIADINDASIKYQFNYWIDFNEISPEEAKHELYRKIIHHFDVAGIGLEVTSSRYRDQEADLMTAMPLPETTLKKIDLFSELSEEEIKMLASLIVLRNFKKEDVVIRQGEAGSSMYILSEGLLKVEIEDAETKEVLTIAKLLPGHFFGEMSLLIGDPRSATITALSDSLAFEISKETMQKLFENHPGLILLLSNKIAARHVYNLKKTQAMLDKDEQQEAQSYSDKLCKLIKNWFWSQDD
jgi:CRP-like cAMP-binding protein